MNDPIPTTYAAWRHCIEVHCGIPLTTAFIDARLAAFADPRDESSRRFAQLYGDAHRARVVGWFHQARTELRESVL